MDEIRIFGLNISLIKDYGTHFYIDLTYNKLRKQLFIDRPLFENIVYLINEYNSNVDGIGEKPTTLKEFVHFQLVDLLEDDKLKMVPLYSDINIGIAFVFIALPQKDIELFTIERIQNSCGDMMEALDFALSQRHTPIYGSFYQKLKFLLKSPKTQKEIEEGYKNAKHALHLKYLNIPNAENTEKIANAAANILNALQGVDEGVLRLGALLVIKKNINGRSLIISETLSPELSILFDNNPQMLNNPNTVYEMLESIKNKNFFENASDQKFL